MLETHGMDTMTNNGYTAGSIAESQEDRMLNVRMKLSSLMHYGKGASLTGPYYNMNYCVELDRAWGNGIFRGFFIFTAQQIEILTAFSAGFSFLLPSRLKY
jgi:hypothetical protein